MTKRKRKFPIAFSSLATSPFPLLIKWCISYGISPKYVFRFFISSFVSLVAEPFRIVENLAYNRKLKAVSLPTSPIFILGHWRSGTTLLHNLLCQDDQFAFITTYQSVFPNQFFTGRWLFKKMMKALMPAERPVDHVRLSADFPQEEGFALCSCNSYSFYLFWYFPRLWLKFYEKFVSCSSSSPQEISKFNRNYKKLIAQSLLDQGRQQFISKNPANTGRIKQLLQIFPGAKFIYIYRNPLMVFQSTLKYFDAVMESLQMQKYDSAELTEMIFNLYERLIHDYEDQKNLIPAGHLIEMRYEDFTEKPLDTLKKIYATLEVDHFEKALPSFTSYMNTQNQSSESGQTIDIALEQKIRSRWQFAFIKYGYQ